MKIRKKTKHPQIRTRQGWTKMQVVAGCFILALAGCDFFAMADLFQRMEFADGQAFVFAGTAALCLEGLPLYLGIALSEKKDKNRYMVNDKERSNWAVWISFIALIGSFALMVSLRCFWIKENGGYEAFQAGEYGGGRHNEEFIGQFYLIFLPVLTSCLAFVASWVSFRSSYYEKAEGEVDRRREIFLARESVFQETYQSQLDARIALWTSLAEPEEKMPSLLNEYRLECFSKIRQKLIHNCREEFPTQIELYNDQVESYLAKCISDLSACSTLPQSISNISVKDIIELYESSISSQADAWVYETASPYMENELQSVLENAIIVAQFNTAVTPYHEDTER